MQRKLLTLVLIGGVAVLLGGCVFYATSTETEKRLTFGAGLIQIDAGGKSSHTIEEKRTSTAPPRLPGTPGCGEHFTCD